MLPFLADLTLPERIQSGFERFYHFFAVGGWYMLPIVICYLVGFTIVVFKFLDLRREQVVPAALCQKLAQVEDLVAAGKLKELTQAIRGHDSVLSRICEQALLPIHPSKESAERSTEALAREEISRLERGLPMLEVIFTITPMLGLIGTTSGLVTIFGSFGARAAGPEQAALISQGISEALNTTIAGLAVAVPCYIFQSHFARRLEKMALRMATLTNGLLGAAYRVEVDAPAPPPLKAVKAQPQAAIAPERPDYLDELAIHPNAELAE